MDTTKLNQLFKAELMSNNNSKQDYYKKS